ncbi:hypothetical protein AAU01_39390 [Paenarthrobacter aurescens]|uniref:Uncharacterized protein n=1 Tax=Paenarthrobacter aurescens TaxID=43663 RepID=A0A4Y3NGN7_PAEAU|nr:hypothetical protein AAU01_39390 [Paenarthrobacter aurescens]
MRSGMGRVLVGWACLAIPSRTLFRLALPSRFRAAPFRAIRTRGYRGDRRVRARRSSGSVNETVRSGMGRVSAGWACFAIPLGTLFRLALPSRFRIAPFRAIRTRGYGGGRSAGTGAAELGIAQ